MKDKLESDVGEHSCSSVSSTGLCMSCHWWFRFDKSQLVGDCVWHNGTKRTVASKLRFKGTLKAQADFGCVCWEKDRRECTVCGNRVRNCLCDPAADSSG